MGRFCRLGEGSASCFRTRSRGMVGFDVWGTRPLLRGWVGFICDYPPSTACLAVDVMLNVRFIGIQNHSGASMALSFAADIRPLFRDGDIGCMKLIR